MYSTYEVEHGGTAEDESRPTDARKVVILGGGPNRIGQGIEFDYCCCHACFALTKAGYETIMVNCNPETVSTDYDTSDRLYFEPLTLEHVLEILRVEQENGTLHGVIVQFGGQTPLKLANALHDAGIPILGTTPTPSTSPRTASASRRCSTASASRQPANGIARSADEAPAVARAASATRWSSAPPTSSAAAPWRSSATTPSSPATSATPCKSRATRRSSSTATSPTPPRSTSTPSPTATDVLIAGVMEHIEEAGVHSGDSACSLPPYSLTPEIVAELKRQTNAMALALGVVGLMNVQFAIQDDDIYVLEVNPRASRTVPFVAKATDSAIAAIAARVMAGEPLSSFPLRPPYPDGVGPDDPLPYADPLTLADPQTPWFSVKEAVMPFNRFPGVDTLLGPEMRSTGEVMGWDRTFARAFLKAQMGAGTALPQGGTLFVSVKDGDKNDLLVEATRILHDLGFRLLATGGTATFLAAHAHPRHPRQQGLRGPPPYRGHPQGRRRPDRLQHHRRLPIHLRLPRHSRADPVGKDPLLHNSRRRAGSGSGHAQPAGGRTYRAVLAGIALAFPGRRRNEHRSGTRAPFSSSSDILFRVASIIEAPAAACSPRARGWQRRLSRRSR